MAGFGSKHQKFERGAKKEAEDIAALTQPLAHSHLGRIVVCSEMRSDPSADGHSPAVSWNRKLSSTGGGVLLSRRAYWPIRTRRHRDAIPLGAP
jgi:hypothetical protein